MKKEKIIIILAMLLILAIGIFLRLYKIGEKSFAVDEFLDINAIYGYYKTGQWQAWDFNNEFLSFEDVKKSRDERSRPYRWQVAQLLKILPLNETTARLASIFWGIISIIVIYFAGSYFSGKKLVGVLCAFLLAVNISAIQTDRTLRMYAMFIPVFLLFSWFLFRFLEDKYKGNNRIIKKLGDKTGLNAMWIIPAAFFGLLSLSIHDLTLNIIFVLTLYLLVQFYFSTRKKKSFFNKYPAMLAAFFTFCLISYLFFRNRIGSDFGDIHFFMANFSYFPKISTDYSFYPLVIILIFLGIYFSIKDNTLKKKIIWVGMCYFAILLSAVFLWHHKPSERYLYFIKPFEIILLAVGIYQLADFLKEKFARNKKIFALPLIFLLMLVPNCAYFFSSENMYKRPAPENEMDYKKVYGYVMENRNEGDALVTRRSRNYYWRGQKMKVYPVAADVNRVKLSLENLQDIISGNPCGWIVISDDDKKYVKGSALKYMKENLEKIEIENVGDGDIYRWGVKKM